jgi:hypothetical protein
MTDKTIVLDTKKTPVTPIPQNNDDPISPYLAMIEKNISSTSIENMEKLLGLHERWMAGQSLIAFNQAVSKFQSIVPEIPKTKQAYNYKYAPLDDIAEIIKKALYECGLSYTFKTDQTNGSVTVTCVISHVGGHSESNSLTAPPDPQQKNAVMANMSTVTYLRRYTLTGALGITTADEDKEQRLGDIIKNNEANIDWPLEISASSTVPELMAIYRKAQKTGHYEQIKALLSARKEEIQNAKKGAKK